MSASYLLKFSQDGYAAANSFDGRLLAESTEAINAVLDSIDQPLIDDFVYQDFSDFGDLAGELDVDLSELSSADTDWYEADDGINWLNALIASLDGNAELPNRDSLLSALNDFLQSLEKAKADGVKWRLEINE